MKQMISQHQDVNTKTTQQSTRHMIREVYWSTWAMSSFVQTSAWFQDFSIKKIRVLIALQPDLRGEWSAQSIHWAGLYLGKILQPALFCYTTWKQKCGRHHLQNQLQSTRKHWPVNHKHLALTPELVSIMKQCNARCHHSVSLFWVLKRKLEPYIIIYVHVMYVCVNNIKPHERHTVLHAWSWYRGIY